MRFEDEESPSQDPIEGLAQTSASPSPAKHIICDYDDFNTIDKESRPESPKSSGRPDYPLEGQNWIASNREKQRDCENIENYITEDNPLTERFLNEYMTAENQMYCFQGAEEEESAEGDPFQSAQLQQR